MIRTPLLFLLAATAVLAHRTEVGPGNINWKRDGYMVKDDHLQDDWIEKEIDFDATQKLERLKAVNELSEIAPKIEEILFNSEFGKFRKRTKIAELLSDASDKTKELVRTLYIDTFRLIRVRRSDHRHREENESRTEEENSSSDEVENLRRRVRRNHHRGGGNQLDGHKIPPYMDSNRRHSAMKSLPENGEDLSSRSRRP